ncbi:MAG: endonuclease domain-containing protein [Chloroflexi bacterium]|nr:MAG: endonuclease domain-containing protein [Chloroflexota bacterium]
MHSPETYRARELRNNMSGTERRVWYRLRGKRLGGFKFRRQLSIGPYFADFVCLSARLVVEIDGEFHTPEADQRKTSYLESQGFRVLRIRASWTDRGLDDVIDTILRELESTEIRRTQPPP